MIVVSQESLKLRKSSLYGANVTDQELQELQDWRSMYPVIKIQLNLLNQNSLCGVKVPDTK